MEIGGVVGNRGGYGRRGARSSGEPALVNAAGEDNDTNADENNNTNSIENMADCHWAKNEGITYMGYSMRTDTPFPLRYTEWVRRRVTSTSVYTPACLLFAPYCFTRDIIFRW